MKLFTDIELNRVGTRDTIIGPIYWELEDNKMFPYSNWTDFVNYLLYWWTFELLKLLDGSYLTARFVFMEGSFDIKLSREGDTTIRFIFFENNRQVGTSVIRIDDLATQLFIHSKELVKYYNRLRIENDEITSFKKNVKSLKAYINLHLE